LPEDIQELLQIGRLSTGHARTLLGVDQIDIQRRIAKKIIEGDLSVRATEQMVKLVAISGRNARKKQPKASEGDANYRAAESKLRRHFGTRVRIVPASGTAAGRIELEYYNQGDLDRLYSLLTRPQM
jgi:ParB family chromosome partitioning protein